MRIARRLSALLPVLCLAALATPAETEVVPSCPSPQLFATPRHHAEGVPSVPAWNGQDFGILWNSNAGTRFQRIFADGTAAGNPVNVPISVNTYYPMRLLWNGSGYAGLVTSAAATNTVVFFRLDASGALLGTPVVLAGTVISASNGDLAWNGSGYAVVWVESLDVYGALLDANGVVTHPRIALAVAADTQLSPRVTWARAGGNWLVAWQDNRSGLKQEIYLCSLSATGAPGPHYVGVSGSSHSTVPALADSGSIVGMAWTDYGSGNQEIMFAPVNASGTWVGTPVRVTNDTGTSSNAFLSWNGGEFGLFWSDGRGGFYDPWFQRISQKGALLGEAVQFGYGTAASRVTGAAAPHGYLVAHATGPGFVVAPLGCGYAETPSCPEAVWAYGVSGASATISWAPVVSSYTDIAYYQVWRADRATPVGLTSNRYFSDTGLSAGTTYQFYVRAVNAAQIASSECPNSLVYVKPTNAVALAVRRDGNDVALSWTDAGQSTYRVMRGASPQVLTTLGTTAATTAVDANAAAGPSIWFYSIDLP